MCGAHSREKTVSSSINIILMNLDITQISLSMPLKGINSSHLGQFLCHPSLHDRQQHLL